MENIHFDEQAYLREMERWERYQKKEEAKRNGMMGTADFMTEPRIQDFFSYRPTQGNLRPRKNFKGF
jgi:hypothetical protein